MKPAKIMIVEDNSVVAEDCRDSLEAMGYHVIVCVASGEESVEEAETKRPDVVLMDIRLRDRMDGIDAAGQIYSRFGIPVLFLSAYSDPELLLRAKRVGSFGYLVKPFEERELRAMLEVTLYKARMERERRELEARLREARKNEAVGRIIGGMAHLFNNLLAVIVGNLELAQEAREKTNRVPEETLADAWKAAMRAAEINRRIVTCLGRYSTNSTPLDLSDAVRTELGRIRTNLPETISLESDLPASGPVIQAGPGQLSEILHALVDNSAEALEKEASGRIAISARTSPSSAISSRHRFPMEWAGKDSDYACLEVADTDQGMETETIERIFDPFFTGKFMGRGLGLSVALGIVQTHGGCVTVESAPGRGSVFRVYFPLSAAPLPAPRFGRAGNADSFAEGSRCSRPAPRKAMEPGAAPAPAAAPGPDISR